jgi:hypothetical protein
MFLKIVVENSGINEWRGKPKVLIPEFENSKLD